MEVVQLLVAADGVHVGVEALTRRKAVLAQRHALPLGQGLDDLDGLARLPGHVERYGALDAVEVVIEAGALLHEERGRHTREAHLAAELALEGVADVLDRLLRLADGHPSVVVVGQV